MISFKEAHEAVLNSQVDYGNESVDLHNCVDRILAENITADRDFPPFDRVTKDGIAINYKTYNNGQKQYFIQGIAAAGDAKKKLDNSSHCLEVMTGAILPTNTDTVIMYENLERTDRMVIIKSDVTQGQNIHYKATDQLKGNVLLNKNERLTKASIGLLATVGKKQIKVKKLPRIAIISTGNELVPIDVSPEPHQIRSSNSITLKVLLSELKIKSKIFHVADIKETIRSKLDELNKDYDVLILSGGVSMGKYDYLPEVFEQIGIQKIFHKVAQRPGKPFWFGQDALNGTTVFSFPGNPASTYVNFHIYFKDWLNRSLNQTLEKEEVALNHDLDNSGTLTRFPLVKTSIIKNHKKADLIKTSGSGDLVSLSRACGVVEIPEKSYIKKGDLLRFISF